MTYKELTSKVTRVQLDSRLTVSPGVLQVWVVHKHSVRAPQDTIGLLGIEGFWEVIEPGHLGEKME